MKRLFFSVAVLATVASCSTNEVVDVASSSVKSIGFSTLNDRATKVANKNADGSNSTYSVYAINAADDTAWYITKETITPADGGDTSVNTYYWPADGSASALDFYAFAPATVLDVTKDADGVATDETNSVLDVEATATAGSSESITLTYTVNSVASEDFTVATPVRDTFYAIADDADNSGDIDNEGDFCIDGETTSATAGTVSLVFSHMLAKATISVKLGEGLSSTGFYIGLDGAEFNVVNDQVKVALDNATETPSVTAVAGSSATYAYDLAANAIPIARTTEELEEDDSVAAENVTEIEGTQELMFAPQADTDICSIDLNGLVIVTKDGASTLVPSTNARYSFTNEEIEFKSGYAYAITITIDGDDEEIADNFKTIKFSSSITEANWSTATEVALSATESDEEDM